MLKRFFIIFIFLCSVTAVYSAETAVLSAGISLNETVPSELMGTWRVVSKLTNTDSPENFKNVGVVLWNLSRQGDVITLYSPFTGAEASVKVQYVKDNTVKFTKEGNYEDRLLTDTVEITLMGDTFSGRNYLTLQKSSASDFKHAEYVIVGKRISGSGVLE